jgi:hypothetical protein
MVPETVCKTALFRAFIAYHLETKLMPILGSMHQQFATSDGATPAVVLRRGTADPTQPSGRSPWRMILLASLGGALELYDFVVFGMFASASVRRSSQRPTPWSRRCLRTRASPLVISRGRRPDEISSWKERLYDKHIRPSPAWHLHMLSFVAPRLHPRRRGAWLGYCFVLEALSSHTDRNAD